MWRVGAMRKRLQPFVLRLFPPNALPPPTLKRIWPVLCS